MLRWWLRAVRRHGCRMLALIDAKAILAATAKGRSGAQGFKQILRSIAAHLLAGNVLIYPLYIPSKDNPSDAPSRGKRFRRGVKRHSDALGHDANSAQVPLCPSCGFPPERHPVHLPKHLQGQGLFCRGSTVTTDLPRLGFDGHAFRNGCWISYVRNAQERCRDPTAVYVDQLQRGH